MTDAERLAEAKEALHRLETGTLEVEITTEQGTAKYKAPESTKLEAYITGLERKVAGRTRRPRAIAIRF